MLQKFLIVHSLYSLSTKHIRRVQVHLQPTDNVFFMIFGLKMRQRYKILPGTKAHCRQLSTHINHMLRERRCKYQGFKKQQLPIAGHFRNYLQVINCSTPMQLN
jgi:hypothetical protein